MVVDDTNSVQKVVADIGGVVLTFDDDYVEDWKKADTKLRDYSWKATFCICRIGIMNRDRMHTLQDFQNYGHEIAGHGANHVNTLDYIATNGFQKFYEDEITPMMAKMNANGLNVTSFAYPYGVRSNLTDEQLFKTFSVLRATTYGAYIPENQSCYYSRSKVVFGLGIDDNYAHFSMPYILDLLAYANSQHKILILYSHKPVEVVTENYQTKMENLVSICNYVKQNHMRFYTLSDLSKIKG
ncbi:polysaccharide deacetylase [Flavobacterium cellulosilyticum]|uniref:Polysaccharide deacetylase n=1 Tax=Flavobacterium cellulosilyticum TaxID=2541731 RepID=A0A4R5CA80_9FLAO|nr:polysaccharide deacetylase [Flavobacterium cellulosilyticum]